MIKLLKAMSCILGAILLLVGLVSLADPEGTKFANDANPFGPSPSLLRSVLLIIFSIALMLWPFFFPKRRKVHQ